MIKSVERLGKEALVDEEREAIRLVLLDELLERGINSCGEPDPYGKRLDHLIGTLRYY